MMQTDLNRSLAKGFWSATYYLAVEDAVHNGMPEPWSVNKVAAKLADCPSVLVPVAKFIKHEIEKNSLDKAKMARRFVKLSEAVKEKKLKTEDRIPTRTIDSAWSPVPLPTYPATGRRTRKRAALQSL